jgi:hypothetical protein
MVFVSLTVRDITMSCFLCRFGNKTGTKMQCTYARAYQFFNLLLLGFRLKKSVWEHHRNHTSRSWKVFFSEEIESAIRYQPCSTAQTGWYQQANWFGQWGVGCRVTRCLSTHLSMVNNFVQSGHPGGLSAVALPQTKTGFFTRKTTLFDFYIGT